MAYIAFSGSFPLKSHPYRSRARKCILGHVRPAKTQISLRIRAVWSESSLSARRNLGSVAILKGSNEGYALTALMRRLTKSLDGPTWPTVHFLILRPFNFCSSEKRNVANVLFWRVATILTGYGDTEMTMIHTIWLSLDRLWVPCSEVENKINNKIERMLFNNFYLTWPCWS